MSASDKDDRRTLWHEARQGRFFLVPDSASLPEGGLALTNFLGQSRQVDGTAIARFEISKVEAGQRVQDRISRLLVDTKEAFSQLGGAQADLGAD